MAGPVIASSVAWRCDPTNSGQQRLGPGCAGGARRVVGRGVRSARVTASRLPSGTRSRSPHSPPRTAVSVTTMGRRRRALPAASGRNPRRWRGRQTPRRGDTVRPAPRPARTIAARHDRPPRTCAPALPDPRAAASGSRRRLTSRASGSSGAGAQRPGSARGSWRRLKIDPTYSAIGSRGTSLPPAQRVQVDQTSRPPLKGRDDDLRGRHPSVRTSLLARELRDRQHHPRPACRGQAVQRRRRPSRAPNHSGWAAKETSCSATTAARRQDRPRVRRPRTPRRPLAPQRARKGDLLPAHPLSAGDHPRADGRPAPCRSPRPAAPAHDPQTTTARD